jgi:esterase/lipase superfamily enzyme
VSDDITRRWLPGLIADEKDRNAQGLARGARGLLNDMTADDLDLITIALDVARRLLEWDRAKEALSVLNRLRTKVRVAKLIWPHPSVIDGLRAAALTKLERHVEALQIRRRIVETTRKEEGPFSAKLAAEMEFVLAGLKHVGAPLEEVEKLDQQIMHVRRMAAAEFEHLKLERADGSRPRRSIDPQRFWTDDQFDESTGITSRVVYFATNRKETGDEHPYTRFSGARSENLSYGRAIVTLPPNRSPGAFPQNKSSLTRNKFFHIVVTDMRVESIEEFDASARERLAVAEERSGRREVLVFVHGYHTTFAQALERTAQLAEDLRIDGVAAAFSWPSRGGFFDYWADREEATDKALEDLSAFLMHMKRDWQADVVHLVAHSMGCRFLSKALDKTAGRPAGVQAIDGKALFGHVIYAAPDLDHDDFPGPVERAQSIVSRATLYQSSRDIVLKASSYFNGGYPRAGDAIAPLARASFDAIDASAARSRTLGHDYLTIGVIEDLRALLWLNLSVERREAAHFTTREVMGLPYYTYTADRTPLLARAIMHASFLVRDYGRDALDRLHEIVAGMGGQFDLELAPLREQTMAIIREVLPDTDARDAKEEVA